MFVHLNFNINIESGLFLQICQNQQSHGAFCGPYALSFWRQLYWDRHYPPNLVNASWLYLCYSSAGRAVLGETVPEVLSTVRAVLRPRAQFLPIRTDLGRWITFFFSNSDLKVSEKFSFTLQRKCVEVGRVRVNEARDRLQTKTNITWLLAR